MENDNQLISIIIPIYNTEQYIARCLESIQKQTYHSFEVILVDDGSKDKSVDVCNRFCEKDKRFVVFSQPNSGASAARNKGLELSKGDFICFVDSDDYLSENFLKTLHTLLCQSNSLVSMCGLSCVNEKCEIVKSPFKEKETIDGTVDLRDSVMSIGKNVAYGVVWNKMYKRIIFDDLLFFEGKTFEDEIILHHIYEKANGLVCTSETLYYYVLRKTSKMHEKYSLEKMDIVYAYLDRLRFVSSNAAFTQNDICFINNRLLDFFESALIHSLFKKVFIRKFRSLFKDYKGFVRSLPFSDKRTNLFLRFPIISSLLNLIKKGFSKK